METTWGWCERVFVRKCLHVAQQTPPFFASCTISSHPQVQRFLFKLQKKTMLCFPFKLEVIPNFRPHREWENKWDMFARVRLQAVSSASDDSGALVVGYRKTRQYRWARCCVREVKLSPVMRDSKSNQRLRSKLCCNQQHPHKHTHTEQSWCCAREITYLGKHMLNVN